MKELAVEQTFQDPKEKSSDMKLLERLNSLEERKKELLNKLAVEDGDKNFLEMDLEDLERQIEQCKISIKKCRKDKKYGHLRVIAGKKNVDEINAFTNRKKDQVEAEKETGEEFLKSFNEFKQRKRGHG